MGIAYKLLIPGNEDFLELTYGDKSIIINKTRSHKMSLVAGLLAKNKEATNLLLSRRGLPVPEYIVINQMGEEALRFLQTYGKVTVKPLDLNRSIGVTLGIQNEEELEAAIRTALLHSSSAMLQRHIEGKDYRILVIDGDMIGVLEYRPAFVQGDGQSTIEQLIVELNQNQLKRNVDETAGSYQPVDATSEAIRLQLSAQGRSLHEIAERDACIELFGSGNVAANMISEVVTDRTDVISPENVQAAVEAAKALQIDVAGVDIRCRDIGSPLNRENGGILEVNALPDLIDPHLFFQGSSTDAVKRYLHYLFQ